MLKAIDVARLTRPSQIRCRPNLFPLVRSFHRSSRNSKPGLDDLEGFEYSGKGRLDHLDFLQAQELERAKRKDAATARPFRTSNLPSLMNKKNFGPRPKDLNTDATSAEASSSKISGVGVPGSTAPSRKGKEKAIELNVDFQLDDFPSSSSSFSSDRKLRRNPVGVQMLSPSLHSQLFPGESLTKPPQSLLNTSLSHLRANGLSPDGAAVLPEINFDIPPIQGKNIRDHFYNVGQHTAEPYLSMAKGFMTSDLPEMPKNWEMDKAGWTKYHSDGRMEAVDDLSEETLVSFDVETLYKLSPFPVMATAVTPNNWYSWLSPTIFEDPPEVTPNPPEPWETKVPSHHPHDLIPLFKGPQPRVVIGHNVGYDRARVKEEYSLDRTSTRWLDTLSLHVSTRGITSVQRPAWMAHRKNKKAKLLRDQESKDALLEIAEENGDPEFLQGLQDWTADSSNEMESSQNTWQDVTSVNSLAEVANLHCGIPVDKSIRNRFADESIKHSSQLRPELQELLTYCGGDVKITHEVYKKVLPLFLESCPHPASFSGVLSMGNSFLPVDEHWQEYLKNAEATYQKMDEGVKKALRVLAEKLRKEGKKGGDPWSEQLDWSPKTARWAEEVEEVEPQPSTSASSVPSSTPEISVIEPSPTPSAEVPTTPRWLSDLSKDRSQIISAHTQRYFLPLFLQLSYKGHPVTYLTGHYWCIMVPQASTSEYIDDHGFPVALHPKKDKKLEELEEEYSFFKIGKPEEPRKVKLVGSGIRAMLKKGELTSPYADLLPKLAQTNLEGVKEDLWRCVEDFEKTGRDSPWAKQLEWKSVPQESSVDDTSRDLSATPAPQASAPSKTSKKAKSSKPNLGTWPKWYWDLTGPPSRIPVGELDLTFKKTIAPLLLRLQWQGYPLIHSRTHRWLYRVPRSIIESGSADAVQARGGRVKFEETGPDAVYAEDREHYYFRLPHKDGEGKNVGNPLSKHFVKSIESGELASAAAESGDDVAAKAATDATNMNAFCSYWISSRERIMDQMVVYREPNLGMILPQVITMGTVTRRAVEATWLTASNAKKNRVGSELKAMVRAPPGYAIVGADVDSEELWISSVMGDSQFGIHGSTAIGWMTLEGTKSAGTDLHSKTASILGISRDAAKVFNYSRIYGAGKKHAVQLLLQGDSKLTKDSAGKLADNLYKATKGHKTTRNKNLAPAAIPSIWHGGSESYLFNTLEAIALSDRPTTPALGCGITKALRKSYLEEGSSYLPSRVNWVVQSSGVDYLHLLIVSMEYLIEKYEIQARYLISVHDEVRYLAKEEDKYRLSLALQIANVWTRALFCYNLGLDDMPQGIAFFSAVDIDHVLRKEVFLTCETPSHPHVIPPGESLDITQLLKKTNNGDLGKVIKENKTYRSDMEVKAPVALFPGITSETHRLFLEAQARRKGDLAKKYLDGLEPVVDSVEEVRKRGFSERSMQKVRIAERRS
ncbi:hypothetical protein I302_105464 [Kwoniella bestiolae CBS 10118]|uniref:Mitochondrial DNA polymerase catalytic subunit n=1 Tax=Kwoniella bestiolae CBS 10118 TaxID=1296100 RepID=A0A1B9FT67_9TREE|nr:DNA polymerase gamma 1 [Kwoniella bestiolae CBS 10118]OCF21965.1 DNA polymerase gamma 1 [Kwoniella bestiolae CBS 10118]